MAYRRDRTSTLVRTICAQFLLRNELNWACPGGARSRRTVCAATPGDAWAVAPDWRVMCRASADISRSGTLSRRDQEVR